MNIKEIIGVKEDYELPTKLMDIITDEKRREELFDKWLEENSDIEHDTLSDYFQGNQVDRKVLMQDFTPQSIIDIIAGVVTNVDHVIDICAGTGGLTIGVWKNNKDAIFECEELATSTIPFLLFNLAIRNIQGEVRQKDVLNNKVECCWKLSKGQKYSKIEVIK